MPTFTSHTIKFSSAQAVNPYTSYAISVTYVTRYGILQLPVAPQGSIVLPSEIVQTSLPLMGKVVHWVAERQGAHPIIPHPVARDQNGNIDSNLVLVHQEITPVSRNFDAEGGMTYYRISGVYHYAYRSAPLNLFYPTGDYDADSPDSAASTMQIGTGDYRSDLIA